MRVIAGSARRTLLQTLEGFETRPTTDRTKETLFNMLAPHLQDIYLLDLFAGSGAIGIEALSRGAREVIFVENNPKAIECIKANLKKTKLEKKATILGQEALMALRRLEGKKPFDIIFMDPPYEALLEKKVLEYLVDSDLCTGETIIIVEASRDTDFSYLEGLGYTLVKRKEYRSNMHIFIERERGKDIC